MADQLDRVQAGYNRWSVVYDHDANPLPALEEPIVRQWLGDVAGLKVLDLGCGTGRHALWLAEAGAEVTAVDFSPGMLAEAQSKPGAHGVKFLQHDLHKPLPFAAQAFDTIVSGLVLEHLNDLASFFADARRVLKPAGRAVVSAMHPAMFLRGSQARFTDPDSGEIVQPGSLAHALSDLVMAAIHGGFQLANVGEFAPDGPFADRFPRAEKYIDYPMLLVMELTPTSRN
ncbi:MAG: class I SAM-dependent methyltransferase [Bythopirellula sp.]